MVQGTVRSNGREESVRFLVDSGAAYSLLPQPVWRSLTLAPKREMEFVLADGTVIRRAISECYIVLPQGEGHTPIVLYERFLTELRRRWGDEVTINALDASGRFNVETP